MLHLTPLSLKYTFYKDAHAHLSAVVDSAVTPGNASVACIVPPICDV